MVDARLMAKAHRTVGTFTVQQSENAGMRNLRGCRCSFSRRGTHLTLRPELMATPGQCPAKERSVFVKLQNAVLIRVIAVPLNVVAAAPREVAVAVVRGSGRVLRQLQHLDTELLQRLHVPNGRCVERAAFHGHCCRDMEVNGSQCLQDSLMAL